MEEGVSDYLDHGDLPNLMGGGRRKTRRAPLRTRRIQRGGAKPRIKKQTGSRSLGSSSSSTSKAPKAPKAPKPPKSLLKKVGSTFKRAAGKVGATVRKTAGKVGTSIVSQASKLKGKISAKFKKTPPELSAFEKGGKEQAALVTKLKAAKSSKAVKMSPDEMKKLSDDLTKRGVKPEDRQKILGGVTVAETYKAPSKLTTKGRKTLKAAGNLDKDSKDLDNQIKKETDPAKKAELKKQKKELDNISKKIKSGEPLSDKEIETYKKQRSKKGKTTGEIDDELSTVPRKTRRASGPDAEGGPSKPKKDDGTNGPSKPKDGTNGPSKPKDDDKNLPSGVTRNASGVLRDKNGNPVSKNEKGVVRDKDGNPVPGQTVQHPAGPVIVPQGSGMGGMLGASILASSLPGVPGGAVVPGSVQYPPNYNPSIPFFPPSIPPAPPIGNGPSPQPAPNGKTWAVINGEWRAVDTVDATGQPSGPIISGPSQPSILSNVDKQLQALAGRLGVSGVTASGSAVDNVTKLKAGGASAKELKDAGFSADVLKAAGYTVLQLRAAGFTALDLYAAGFVASDLATAGFSETELRSAGVPTANVQSALAEAAGFGAAGAAATTAFGAAGFQPGATTFAATASPYGSSSAFYDPAIDPRSDADVPSYVQAELRRGEYDVACREAPYAIACRQLMMPPPLPKGGVPTSVWNF